MAPPRALLVDIDGVLVVSWQTVPGAVEAFRTLREEQIPLRLLTNTTSRTRAGIARALRETGFDVEDDEVMTVASAATAFLNDNYRRAHSLILNHGDGVADLAGLSIAEPDSDPADIDVVVLGGAGPEFTYDALNRALAALVAGADLVALHRNLLWRTAAGLQLDTGAYVLGLERAANVTATVIGKPSPAMFAAALASLDLEASEVAMVGDDLDSDVRGAQSLGITGVQVRTGKFRAEQLLSGPPPDVVLDSFADMPGWLGRGGR